jgi:hypothetical protein
MSTEMNADAAMAAAVSTAMAAMMALRYGWSGECGHSRKGRQSQDALSKHDAPPQQAWTTLETSSEPGERASRWPAPIAPLVPDEAGFEFRPAAGDGGPAS